MWKLGLLGLAYLSCSVDAGPTTQTPQNDNCTIADYCVIADPNNPDLEVNCNLPDCRCSGDDPTYDSAYDVKAMPQILYLTFDDGFTPIAEEQFYRDLFNGTYKNPNGDDIRATHFLTHSYTDYTLVNQYWRLKGHEMASHSVTHRTDQNYWKGINAEGWTHEAEGMRQAITQFANIPKKYITGFRSPYLQMGGDEQYKALFDSNFTYDCSWASRDYGYQHLDSGLYPYTMDYATAQDCEVGPCPECSYPGFWVQPMLDLEDNWFGSNPLHPDWGQPCSMLDGCIFIEEQTKEAVHEMLMRNFLKVYNGNRAPFGLYMHAAWFFGEQTWHFEGYKAFLQNVTASGDYTDVWIVPVSEGIDFYKNTPNLTHQQLMDMGDDNPFATKNKIAEREEYECDPLESCSYQVDNEDIHNQERYMHICRNVGRGKQSCPKSYPWLTTPCGGNRPCV